jgi:opacity protein-like surface antigen
MNKIRITILLLFALLISSSTNAQLLRSTSKVGTTAAQFLKIGAGARAIGMGGAYSALGGDIYSVYWNPAGLASIKTNTEIAFNHAEWLADISYDFAAAALNMGEFGVLSASFTSMRVPEDDVRTFEAPEGDGRTWDASSLAITVGYSKKLTDRFSFGAQVKFIRESIWNSSATGFALDIGTQYITPFNDLVIGASVSNFGSTMSLDGRDIQFNYDPNDNLDTGPNNVPSNLATDEFDLPLTFRIGLAMDIYNSRYFRVTGAIDATHPNDNTEYVNSGLEFAYDDMFFLRAGYKSLFMDNTEEGLTYGAGFKYTLSGGMNIFVNYGYADYGRLENVQFVDIGLGF